MSTVLIATTIPDDFFKILTSICVFVTDEDAHFRFAGADFAKQ